MKDQDKMQTKKALEEREAQIEMAREVHNEVFGAAIGEQAKLAAEEPNWALYNYILNIVDMSGCKTKQEALHTMYRQLWPHIKKYHNDRESLLRNIEEEVEGSSEYYGIAPLTMATNVLNKVSEAARVRSKNNIYIPKKKKIEIVN